MRFEYTEKVDFDPYNITITGSRKVIRVTSSDGIIWTLTHDELQDSFIKWHVPENKNEYRVVWLQGDTIDNG